MYTIFIIICFIIDVWVIISIIDFFIYTLDCHKWNFINVICKLIIKIFGC